MQAWRSTFLVDNAMLNSLLTAAESIRTGAMRLSNVHTAADFASFPWTSSYVQSASALCNIGYMNTATTIAHVIVYSVSPKKSPLWFSDIFSKTIGNL